MIPISPKVLEGTRVIRFNEATEEQEYGTVMHDLGTYMRVVADDDIRPSTLWNKVDCIVAPVSPEEEYNAYEF